MFNLLSKLRSEILIIFVEIVDKVKVLQFLLFKIEIVI